LVAEDEIPPGKIFTDPVTKMSFVLVKGGCFKMGSNNGNSDEMPVHEVCVDDFYMGEYEVTQAQYEWIMGHNPSSFNGCDSPVESVSWEDAQAYIRKLSQVSRKNYRLPSEAEWEYAARSDWKDETTSSIDPMLQEYAWYIKNLGNQPSSVERRPNGLGLYDMDYNVWEWVSDWYGANYYANSPRTNPQGPPSGSRRVIRAGNGSRKEPGFAKRYGASPNERSNYFGFRVAFQARSSANGLPAKAQKPGISSSADSPFQDDVAVLNVESVSGPAPR
jgi:formylglycine-generating enzyme required for sulfatase activity